MNLKKVYLLIIILFFSACFQNLSNENQLQSTTTSLSATSNNTTLETEELVASELVISENFDRYFQGVRVSEGIDFNIQVISDFDNFNNEIVFLTALYEGKIFKYDLNTSTVEVLLDLSNEIIETVDKNNEMGLLSMELHPSLEYLLVAYVNKSMQLKVEQYFLDIETLSITDEKPAEILSIQYFDKVHFSGNLIYSDFYDGFIFSAGDGLSDDLGLRSDTLYSFINRGKIILLLSKRNNEFTNPVISYTITENKNIILAYGIRNPWGIGISEDKLFIPDVGRSLYEEVTVLNLPSSSAYFLGYPIYEGPLETDYKLNEIYQWSNEVRSSAEDYLLENYQHPTIFYKHTETENGYRCAVIGGAVLNNFVNDYWTNSFVFMDYCSKELFFYDYKEDNLIASSIEELKIDNYYISKIAQFDNSRIIVLGFTYEVIEGQYIVNNKNFILTLPTYPIFINK